MEYFGVEIYIILMIEVNSGSILTLQMPYSDESYRDLKPPYTPVEFLQQSDIHPTIDVEKHTGVGLLLHIYEASHEVL